ncbi:DNA primase [Aquipuribacter nitratireducens]|uniref:DNA primase n=1 Tax=Aquipuribacter nitratireducens TaxID=650104 RepID=A0ABW0GK54_9MICO
MAGRIKDEDVAAVKERTRIEELVGDHVALRRAGSGSLKGLCPFHDEKTPSFHVRPQLGVWHCFGCDEGGDAIAFVMKIDHLGFTDAVERLAAKAGVQLRYDELSGGRPSGPRQPVGQRQRLVDANAAAERWYAEQLMGGEAAPARTLLAERGFDRAAAEQFGVGYAPRAGEELVRHLRGRGFTDDELVTAGLAGRNQSGRLYDRFRGRLLWPIRDVTGDTVGFGARRLYDDDRIEAKYLNTPDSPLYRKSQVLYGVDLAKRDIARERRLVVVEGYTDVMAAHLAGVTTAVATCGTAFGEEHARLARRLIGDVTATGEVVFTFDGDAAGQKAALRAFAADQQFVARTFVAVEPSGKDPCDLRQSEGDAAVRALVERRVPMFEFAIRSTFADVDLDTEEGRLAGLDRAAPIVAAIKDRELRHRYAVNLDRWLGFLDERFVVSRVARAARGGPGAEGGRPAPSRAEADDPVATTERFALACALQVPDHVGAQVDALGEEAFTVPTHRVVHETILASGGATGRTGAELLEAVRQVAPSTVQPLLTRLAVMDLPAGEKELPRFARMAVAKIAEIEANRVVMDALRRLNRLDRGTDPDAYEQAQKVLLEAQARQRRLRDQALGGEA